MGNSSRVFFITSIFLFSDFTRKYLPMCVFRPRFVSRDDDFRIFVSLGKIYTVRKKCARFPLNFTTFRLLYFSRYRFFKYTYAMCSIYCMYGEKSPDTAHWPFICHIDVWVCRYKKNCVVCSFFSIARVEEKMSCVGDKICWIADFFPRFFFTELRFVQTLTMQHVEECIKKDRGAKRSACKLNKFVTNEKRNRFFTCFFWIMIK